MDADRSQVHLHSYGYKRLVSNRYAETIRNSGFWVRLRENSYPGRKRESFIIYNLPKEKYEEVQAIQAVLSKKGVDIERVYFEKYGKHEYTEGNIGV